MIDSATCAEIKGTIERALMERYERISVAVAKLNGHLADCRECREGRERHPQRLCTMGYRLFQEALEA